MSTDGPSRYHPKYEAYREAVLEGGNEGAIARLYECERLGDDPAIWGRVAALPPVREQLREFANEAATDPEVLREVEKFRDFLKMRGAGREIS